MATLLYKIRCTKSCYWRQRFWDQHGEYELEDIAGLPQYFQVVGQRYRDGKEERLFQIDKRLSRLSAKKRRLEGQVGLGHGPVDELNGVCRLIASLELERGELTNR